MSLNCFKLYLNPGVRSQASYTAQPRGDTYVRLTQTFLNQHFQGKPPAELVVIGDDSEPAQEPDGHR